MRQFNGGRYGFGGIEAFSWILGSIGSDTDPTVAVNLGHTRCLLLRVDQ